MQEQYIHDDFLVGFMYEALSKEALHQVKYIVEEVPDVRRRLNVFQSIRLALPKVHFEPSADTINKILQYSTKTALEAQL